MCGLEQHTFIISISAHIYLNWLLCSQPLRKGLQSRFQLGWCCAYAFKYLYNLGFRHGLEVETIPIIYLSGQHLHFMIPIITVLRV